MTPEAFRVWADVLPEPCALLTGRGQVVATNPAARRAGVATGPLAGFVSPEEAEKLGDLLRRAVRSRQPLPARFVTASGETITARIALLERAGDESWLLLRLADHATSRFWLLTQQLERLSTELSRRTRAEAALSAERERVTVTLQSIGDGVIAVDTERRILLINPVAELLTGWPAAEAIGRPMSEVFRIFHERSGRPAVDPVGKVLETGRIVGLANHTALEARDGTRRSIADSAAPIRGTDGAVLGVVLVFRDVTQQRQMEAELAKASMLESVGVLAGGIAHDFNNILTAILGNLSLAQTRLEPEHPASARVEAASLAGKRAQDLTQQLLTFARGGAPIKKATSIEQVLRETATFVLQGARTVVNFDITPDLWAADADAGQIGQLVHNLMLNAHHAMPAGGVITVRAANEVVGPAPHLPLVPGGYVRVVVEDTGSGIPDENLPRLFQPFFTTKPTGTGLGLATVYSIVHRHGGHVRVENRAEGGARVSFWLPVATDPVGDDAIDGHTAVRGDGRVLLMDDDATLRELAAECFEVLGYQATFAEDGEAAIRAYEQALGSAEPFDVVVMDLTVPGALGGLEATERILALDPNARVVVSSGYSTDPVMAHHRDYGFVGVLPKPWRLEDLARTLAAARPGR